MQITFSSGLAADGKKGSVFENEPEKDETTVEKYVRREKERKARRKEKLKAARGEAAGGDGVDAASAEVDGGSDGQQDGGGDLGFDDPFFAAADGDATSDKKEKRSKAARLARKEERLAADAAADKSRAELSLLMAPDEAVAADGVAAHEPAHFSMAEIARAEKQARRKKRKDKADKTADASADKTAAGQDGFTMDVADPRFAAALDSHDYAIDPTSARFSGTGAMKALLEEGRKRRRQRQRKRGRGDEEDDDGAAPAAGANDDPEALAGAGYGAKKQKTKRREGERNGKSSAREPAAADDPDGAAEVSRLVQKVRAKHGKA